MRAEREHAVGCRYCGRLTLDISAVCDRTSCRTTHGHPVVTIVAPFPRPSTGRPVFAKARA